MLLKFKPGALNFLPFILEISYGSRRGVHVVMITQVGTEFAKNGRISTRFVWSVRVHFPIFHLVYYVDIWILQRVSIFCWGFTCTASLHCAFVLLHFCIIIHILASPLSAPNKHQKGKSSRFFGNQKHRGHPGPNFVRNTLEETKRSRFFCDRGGVERTGGIVHSNLDSFNVLIKSLMN